MVNVGLGIIKPMSPLHIQNGRLSAARQNFTHN